MARNVPIPTGSIFLLASLLLIGGCRAPVPDVQPGLDLNFADLGPIPLKVAHIDVVEDYAPTRTPPHVELQFTVPPDQAIRRWIADRLRAAAGDADLTIDITEADIVEDKLPVEGGLRGAVIDQQNRQWTAHLAATLSLRSIATGRLIATTGFHIEHLRTTPQSATTGDVREAQAELIREAMADFDHMATLTLHQDMPQILLQPEP